MAESNERWLITSDNLPLSKPKHSSSKNNSAQLAFLFVLWSSRVNVLKHIKSGNVMTAALAEAMQRLASNFHIPNPSTVESILADPWVISSLLQKSIRRGDGEMAQRAAHTLFKLKGSAIWRRLMVIGFEDIGVGSPDTLVMTVAAGSDPAWRKQCGGDAHVVMTLARLMAEAAKDRSSDYLTEAGDHPSLVAAAEAMANSSIEARLAVVSDPRLSLPHRAVAVRSVWGTADSPSKSNLAALFTVFRSPGVPEELIVATEIAAVRTREPITIMVPPTWLAANTGQVPSVRDCSVPASPVVGDVPMYALDMHTRLGQSGGSRERIMRCESALSSMCRQNDGGTQPTTPLSTWTRPRFRVALRGISRKAWRRSGSSVILLSPG